MEEIPVEEYAQLISKFAPKERPARNRAFLTWLICGQMTNNHFYDSLKALAEAVVEWLEKLPFARF